MSQLTSNSPPTFEDGGINNLPVLTAVQIYFGSAVGLSGGYARQLVAGDPFAGFALARVDNISPGLGVGFPSTAGSSGSLNVPVKYSGLIVANISGLAVTDIGAPIYMSDGATFTKTATSNSLVGKVHRFVSSGVGVVRFDASAAALALPTITDSTGGTASTTFAAITAGGSYAQADMVAVKNALAQIALMLNNLGAS